MAEEKDLLTNCQDALITLFKSDAVLKEYNWELWDSDQPAKLPRGSMNMSYDGELGYSDVGMITPEITLEGKPKRQKLSNVMFHLEKVTMAANLHTALNEVANGKVKFYQRAERFSIRQVIQGDVRKRTIRFSIAAAALTRS